MSLDSTSNINLDKLPENVRDAIYAELRPLPLKKKLIIFSKIIHGNQFRVTANDLFNINKQTPALVYKTFINNVIKKLNP